jgi:hypothetical protein
MKRMMIRELGKSGDQEFSDDLELLWDYYETILDDPTFSLLYASVKYHALNFILSEAANWYDTKEMDIEEKQSQVFDHWWKMYDRVAAQLQTELQLDAAGFGIAIGVMTKTAPLPYTDFTGMNPSNPWISGLPLPYGYDPT